MGELPDFLSRRATTWRRSGWDDRGPLGHCPKCKCILLNPGRNSGNAVDRPKKRCRLTNEGDPRRPPPSHTTSGGSRKPLGPGLSQFGKKFITTLGAITIVHRARDIPKPPGFRFGNPKSARGFSFGRSLGQRIESFCKNSKEISDIPPLPPVFFAGGIAQFPGFL